MLCVYQYHLSISLIIFYVVVQMLYGKEQKGPVSALTEVNGYLVSAIGQKVCYKSKGHIS